MSFFTQAVNDQTIVGRIYDVLRLNYSTARHDAKYHNAKPSFDIADNGGTILLASGYRRAISQKESFSSKPIDAFAIDELCDGMGIVKVGDYYGMSFNYDSEEYHLICSSDGYCKLTNKGSGLLAEVQQDGRMTTDSRGSNRGLIVDILSYSIHSILGVDNRGTDALLFGGSLMVCDIDLANIPAVCTGI